MRILMTTDTVGGVWTYTLQLAAALAPRNIHIHLATMGAPITDAQRHAAAAHPNITLHPSEFALEWMPDPWHDVDRAGDRLLDLERELRPDLVHLNGYAHGALPFSAPTLIVGHSCVLSWWRAVRHEEAPPEWNEYRRRVTAGLRHARHVLAPSHAMLHSLSRDYGPFRSAGVIYNGRSPAQFRPAGFPPASGSRNAGVPPASKRRLIFSAGRLWDEAKNLGTLARIAPHLPWPLHVAGDTTHPAGGATTIAHAENVTCLGRLSEKQIAARLATAAIYALPVKYEPFGLSILEAALAGCALVVGDIPSMHEIWQDAALYVSPADDAALLNTLNRLISNPAERTLYAARAQLRAQSFSIQRMGHGYVQTYTALVSRFGSSSAAPVVYSG